MSLDPVADLRFAFDHLLLEITQAHKLVDQGEHIELVGLDFRIEELCREVETLEPQDAKGFNEIFDAVISNLETLAEKLRQQGLTPDELAAARDTSPPPRDPGFMPPAPSPIGAPAAARPAPAGGTSGFKPAAPPQKTPPAAKPPMVQPNPPLQDQADQPRPMLVQPNPPSPEAKAAAEKGVDKVAQIRALNAYGKSEIDE